MWARGTFLSLFGGWGDIKAGDRGSKESECRKLPEAGMMTKGKMASWERNPGTEKAF
jgi:hypothetical protein